MRTTCIRHPEREPLIVLRKWQVEACDGNHCAGLLLSFFEYWHNIKIEQSQKAREANNVAENHGDSRDQDESLHQFHTEAQLEAGLLGLYGKGKIKGSLDALVAKGFISVSSNPNPRYAFDKTRHFVFHAETIAEWLKMNYRYAENGLSWPENGLRSSENGLRSSENGSAIPKTTTKTTTKTTNKENISAAIAAPLPSEKPSPKKSPPKKPNTIAKPPDIMDQVWQDFLILRKAQRAPITSTALEGIKREAGKAGISLSQALEICVMRGWRSFKAEWHSHGNGGSSHSRSGSHYKPSRYSAELMEYMAETERLEKLEAEKAMA